MDESGRGGPRVTLPSVHTHLFFSNLLWTSLVPILKPRQTGGSGPAFRTHATHTTNDQVS